MQAIIPVAGAGTRLRPLTYTQPKVLISVAGKPILSFIIESLKENGVTRFIFVIGYLGEKIKDFVVENYPEIDAHFVTQETPEGMGHALFCAREIVNINEPLIIQLGDTITDADVSELVHGETSTLCIKKVEDPRSFGVAELGTDGTIKNVVEKPSIPKSNMALVGLYFIYETKQLFEALAYNVEHNIRTNNEFHLTDALRTMITNGVVFNSYKVEQWFDLGKKEILLETNTILLRKLGDLAVRKGATQNSIIIPPVSIGEGAQIVNSIVGPNVTIGDHSAVQFSIIRDSIVGSYTKLENITLVNSLIGSDAGIKGFSQSLNIGDNTEIDLSNS
ncbi:MAG: NTP transferase domain-containing protein [Chitinophagales bacterium]|nr:NTP transferase domain-containing protein [Chitinophagales bacterium]